GGERAQHRHEAALACARPAQYAESLGRLSAVDRAQQTIDRVELRGDADLLRRAAAEPELPRHATGEPRHLRRETGTPDAASLAAVHAVNAILQLDGERLDRLHQRVREALLGAQQFARRLGRVLRRGRYAGR